MESRAICAGTYDPMTLGHVDLIERASRMFDKVIVAVPHDVSTITMFNYEERIAFAKYSLEHIKNVEVYGFRGFLIDFCKLKDVNVIVRGLRYPSDLEREAQLLYANRVIQIGGQDNVDNPRYFKIETIFLLASIRYSCLSSTMVKRIINLKGNIHPYVQPKVANIIKEKMLNKHESQN